MQTAMVQETTVVPDNSKPWQIALQNPNTTELVFSGFSAVSAVVEGESQLYDSQTPAERVLALIYLKFADPAAASCEKLT